MTRVVLLGGVVAAATALASLYAHMLQALYDDLGQAIVQAVQQASG